MGYILKNTSGLINTKLTDTARMKLSQGKFNISYFQIGDSEVSYNTLPLTYNQMDTNILEPEFNSQNSTGVPESNKQQIKYPFYVDAGSSNTYGIPYMASVSTPVYNRAAMRGFFTGNTTAETISWSALTNSQYIINANYVIEMSALTCTDNIDLILSACYTDPVRDPQAGDFITIYFDGSGLTDCSCVYPTPTPSPSLSPTSTPTPTPTPTQGTTTSTTTTTTNPCVSPSPTLTPSSTCCLTPTPSPPCPPTPLAECVMNISSCYQVLTYKITRVCENKIYLDRNTPNLSGYSGYSRVVIYPGDINEIYDSYTPRPHWNDNVIDFESVCGLDASDVKIWNMNIPWSENPAGLDPSVYSDYTTFNSRTYLGTKEYLGYASSSGQTFYNPITDISGTTDTFYYNSLGDLVYVEPKEQKAIAIIHYTNNTIDFFYGEKFALQPYDPENPQDTTGEARNFKVHLPWIMWHKNPSCCNGETFYVDPANEEFQGLDLFQVNYIQSLKNKDMNTPGIRYYHLWDSHPNIDGYPTRVGKVFPDSKLIIIDDEELIAALSYKSNRNWTLPAPRVSLITPNICGDSSSVEGILSGNNQTLYVTYKLSDPTTCTENLHCNYYPYVKGPNTNCNVTQSQNVAIRFGSEFNCMNIPTSGSCYVEEGYFSSKFEIICQLVEGGGRPEPDSWKIIDFTDQLSGSTIDGYLTQSGITGNTFVINLDNYNSADLYDLGDYISLTPINYSGYSLNFGDEYYFYGNIETDIEATIYEMVYKVNLSQPEFQLSSNPSWTNGGSSYISEIGLYDNEKNLMIVSKLQSPVLRQGVQQFSIKFDF